MLVVVVAFAEHHAFEELLHVSAVWVFAVAFDAHRAEDAVAEADVEHGPREEFGAEDLGHLAVFLGVADFGGEEGLQVAHVAVDGLVDLGVVDLGDCLQEHAVGELARVADHRVVADDAAEAFGGVAVAAGELGAPV